MPPVALARNAAGLWCDDWTPPGAGAEPPVVLLHGACGSLHHWPEVLRTLPHRRVIAVDLPGHGRSPGPGRRTIGEYAREVLALLDALQLGPAMVVGHSMGGAVALTLALEAPARVAALGLVSTGARLRVAPAILQATTDPVAWAGTPALVADLTFGPHASPEAREDFLNALRLVPPAVAHGDFIACDTYDVRPRLEDLKVPTAVVCGEADQLTPPRLSEFLAAHVAGATLTLIPATGHMAPLEAPALTLKALGLSEPGR